MVDVDVDKQSPEAWVVKSYPAYYLVDRAGMLRMADIYKGDIERAVVFLLDDDVRPE